MQNVHSITFNGKSFCFTGKLLDLERKDAENEVKLRTGYVSTLVTSELDYLIIGDIPNPQWKFGGYGKKIDAAIKLRNSIGKPLIIKECDFIDSLALNFPLNSENKKEKFLLTKWIFLDESGKADYFRNLFQRFAVENGFSLQVKETDHNEFLIFHNRIFDGSTDISQYTLAFTQLFNHSDDLVIYKNLMQDRFKSVVTDHDQFYIREVPEGTSEFIRFKKILQTTI
ncbi:MAG: ligase [Mucilaginibacter sp.]|nr:ligase [Mucilaginibacter sp.]